MFRVTDPRFEGVFYSGDSGYAYIADIEDDEGRRVAEIEGVIEGSYETIGANALDLWLGATGCNAMAGSTYGVFDNNTKILWAMVQVNPAGRLVWEEVAR